MHDIQSSHFEIISKVLTILKEKRSFFQCKICQSPKREMAYVTLNVAEFVQTVQIFEISDGIEYLLEQPAFHATRYMYLNP